MRLIVVGERQFGGTRKTERNVICAIAVGLVPGLVERDLELPIPRWDRHCQLIDPIVCGGHGGRIAGGHPVLGAAEF